MILKNTRLINLSIIFSVISFIISFPTLVFADIPDPNYVAPPDTHTFLAFVLGFGITILIEGIIFIIASYRSKQELTVFFIANLLSYSVLNVILFELNAYDNAHPFYKFMPSMTHILITLSVLPLELGVIIFEYLFFAKFIKHGKLLLTVIIANITSATLGYWLLFYLLSHLRVR